MGEPKIADTIPKKVEIEEGKKYFWCACGQSNNQPFCDGSHSGSEFEPMEFTVPQSRSFHMCMCKQTKKRPYCDGSHKSLPSNDTNNTTT